MVRIPYIKIPSVRVGSIDPTSDIGTGGATPVPPTPITYLTQWKIVGNSEVHGQEIWSCGEYNPIDGKYHILVQPLGGSIVDIALTEPLRKVNNVADSIEFSNGVAIVTRNLKEISLESMTWFASATTKLIISTSVNALIKKSSNNDTKMANVIISDINYNAYPYNTLRTNVEVPSFTGIGVDTSGTVGIANISFYNNSSTPSQAFNDFKVGKVLIYELKTPTTETIQVPQIEEADSYSCVISQGAKAVEWSSFETEINSN